MMRFFSLILIAALAPNTGVCEKLGNWDGEIYEPVAIRVVEAKDEKPVVSARVWLLTSSAYYAYKHAIKNAEGFTKANGPIERFGSRVFTDAYGKTTIWTPFKAGGDILGDGSRTTYRFMEGIVIVEDWKHERFESEFESLLPDNQSPKNPEPISITIKLKEKADQSSQATQLKDRVADEQSSVKR